MKSIFLIGLIFITAGCASYPVPAHIQQKVDAIPADQLSPVYMVERESCRAGNSSMKEACREKVRREYLANRMAREERNAQ